MALPVFQRTIVTEAGDVIAGAEVEVVLESTGLAADIFSDRAGNTPRTNPFFTSADGFAKFFAAPDEYRITATGPTGSIVFRFVVLTGDIARQNANSVAITGGSASVSTAAVTDTTDATSTTAAPLKTAGGLAVAKRAYFGSVIEAVGSQIKFPATQNASADANTLDDYEEGTFTPVFTTDGTDFVNAKGGAGTYVKIGKQVTVQLGVSLSGNVSGGTGNVLVTGLPFTTVSLGVGSFSVGRITLTSLGWFCTAVDTTVVPRRLVSGTNAARLLASEVNGNPTPFFSTTITYFV